MKLDAPLQQEEKMEAEKRSAILVLFAPRHNTSTDKTGHWCILQHHTAHSSKAIGAEKEKAVTKCSSDARSVAQSVPEGGEGTTDHSVSPGEEFGRLPVNHAEGAIWRVSWSH